MPAIKGNACYAEDILAEAMRGAIRGVETWLAHKGSAVSWVGLHAQSFAGTTAKQYRKRDALMVPIRGQREDPDAEGLEATLAGPDDVEAAVALREDLSWLRATVAALPPKKRALAEALSSGVSSPGLAVRFGYSRQTARNHTERLIEEIRRSRREPASLPAPGVARAR